jgi:phage-related protein
MSEGPSLKPLIWGGSSREDFREFPEPVQDRMGYALYVAQRGGKHRDSKPLSGFGGAGVLEVIEDFRGDTFRATYTVRLAGRYTFTTPFRRNRRPGPRPRAGTSN